MILVIGIIGIIKIIIFIKNIGIIKIIVAFFAEPDFRYTNFFKLAETDFRYTNFLGRAAPHD